MALNKVEICGVNTSKLTVLTNEEKTQLFERIKEGDEEARQKYIKGNLRLVLSVIKRFSNSNENVDDLFQIGCIGLIKAIDNFDSTLNVKFSTYAVPMIIGEIRRFLRDNKQITEGYGLQGYLCKRKPDEAEPEGANHCRGGHGNRDFQGRCGLCPGCNSESHESV